MARSRCWMWPADGSGDSRWWCGRRPRRCPASPHPPPGNGAGWGGGPGGRGRGGGGGGGVGGVGVVVWPEPQTVPGLTAPAARERGRLVLPARPSQPGIAAVEVDTHMVAEKTPDDSTIHLRVGPQRRVKLIQVAENLVLELDEASEIAGFWLLQVPPFPHVEEGV